MAFAMSKRRSKSSQKSLFETDFSCSYAFFYGLLSRIPTAIFLLFLIYLWSSSTTILSSNVVHVCISSRKFNDLYCLSAGTHPNFRLPFHASNDSSFLSAVANDSSIRSSRETVDVVALHNSRLVPIRNDSSSSSSHAQEDIVDVIKFDGSSLVSSDMMTSNGTDGEVQRAMKLVEENLKEQRSWISNTNRGRCNGRGIYVYDLPSKFNKDLAGQCNEMMPWAGFCKYLSNDALGDPIPELGEGWYNTHQYSLEPIFHSRILKHKCRVDNENEAKLFYVPFYGGLDILRWHFKNVSNDVKDTLSLELLKWLETRKAWKQNAGKDHVFVLGKISWDFRRMAEYSWGTRFLELEQMRNPIKLLIERHPWEVNDIGIPHPTHFHPNSDDQISAWQLKIIQSPRKYLVSFAGAARPNQSESIRSTLISQCTSYPVDKCNFLNCNSGKCHQPGSIINLFVESEFCLQPPGDSPTRKSVFDSLISGCIPVLFDPCTAYYQYPWHLPEDYKKYSVFIDQEEVRNSRVNVVERLMKISKKEKDDMRRSIVYELMPGLVYGDSNSHFERFQDSFDITVNNLLNRVTTL